MRYLRAFWITAGALTAFVFGHITEDEARRRVNEARALIGQPPVSRP